MKTRTFTPRIGPELIIKSRKSAVFFELAQQNGDKYRQDFIFSADEFKELAMYIETIATESWADITPKDADSLGSDYAEYYDRELDNNGYLAILKDGLCIERPTSDHLRMYKFNKRKMESFLYDLRLKVGESIPKGDTKDE